MSFNRTGNQMQEPKFSDEEMEFIPSGKLKKPSKEGESKLPIYFYLYP